MFQKIAKHRANDASNDVHRPPLVGMAIRAPDGAKNRKGVVLGLGVGVGDGHR